MKRITVIGGGFAGLVASIACAEAGARATLYEAHRELGGRARATAPPYIAQDGPQRDRPAVARGDGVFLAGDMVAAPGLLSEVSFHSGLAATADALR